jgi:lysophospholipase L1-like esterase
MMGFLGVFSNEFEVRRLERSFRKGPPPAPTPPVVFYGSSSIRLWATLAEDLGDPRIVNLGFGGSTMEACAHYFERLVVPRKPASLVLYVGDNDLGIGRSAGDVVDSFRTLLGKVDAHLGPIPFAFISIKPSPALWTLIDSIRSVNATIREELARRPRSKFIDIFPAMLGHDGRPRDELYLEDGLHMSRAGYLAWSARILEHREAIFPGTAPDLG